MNYELRIIFWRAGGTKFNSIKLYSRRQAIRSNLLSRKKTAQKDLRYYPSRNKKD